MKHTPEPWAVEDRGGMAATIVGLTRVANQHWNGKFHYLGSLFYKPDMERSVACVNALAGIPDPAKFVEAARKVVAEWDENEIGQIDGDTIDALRTALQGDSPDAA